MKTTSWWLSLVAFGITFLLCFCGASGGSTLFTLGKPHIIEIPSCLIFLCGYGHSILWLRCALQPFGIKLYFRPTLLWESTPIRLADCRASSVEWRNISGPFGNLFLWPTVFRWAVRVVSWPSHQLWTYCVSCVPGQISLEVTSGNKSWSRTIALHVKRSFIHQSLNNISQKSRGFVLITLHTVRACAWSTLTNQSYERWPSLHCAFLLVAAISDIPWKIFKRLS
jgi:hypothetical protein